MNESQQAGPIRRRGVLRWAVALLLAAACTLGAHAEGPAPADLMVPGASVGLVKLGDTRAQVESVFGKPDLVGWTQTKEKDLNLEYHKLNLYFMIHQDKVRHIFVLNPRFRTSSGLGVGSTLEEVEGSLGGNSKRTDGKVGPELLFPSGIRFLFMDNRALGVEIRPATP